MRGKWIVAALLSLAAPAGGLAQGTSPATPDSERIAKARELVEVLRVDAPMMTMLDKIGPVFALAVIAEAKKDKAGLTPLTMLVQTAEGEAQAQQVLNEEFAKAFIARTTVVKTAVAQAYAEDFTVAELNALIGFLRSPVGDKWTRAQVGVMQRASEVGREAGEAAGLEAYEAALARLTEKGAE